MTTITPVTITTVAKLIIDKLQLDEKSGNELLAYITSKGNEHELVNPDQYVKIQELLNGDIQINNFQQKLSSYSQNTQANFSKLKENFGRLQILILMKKIEVAKDNDGIMNALFEALNSKMSAVNSLLASKFELMGGGNNTMWYNKYIYYKKKYLNLKQLLNM